jgi:plastocyanin
MNTFRNLRRLGLMLLFALLGGWTDRPMPATQPATQPATTRPVVRITIDNFRFDPEVVTVPAGTTIQWINHDDVPHTVTANDHKSFASGALDTDEQFSHVFPTAGEFPYFCAVHPHMTARVIVK